MSLTNICERLSNHLCIRTYNAKTAVESRNTEEVTNQLELAKEAIVMAAEESE